MFGEGAAKPAVFSPDDGSILPDGETFLFADPGESSSGEVHLITDVFRWLEGR